MKNLFTFEDIEALLERIDKRKQEFVKQQNILTDKELGEYTLKEVSGICSEFFYAADRVCQGCPFMPLCEYFDSFYGNSCTPAKEKILFPDDEEDTTLGSSFSQLIKYVPDFKTYNVLTKYKRANNEVDITIEEIDKMEVTTEEIKEQVEELNDLKEILLAGDKLGFSYVTKDNEPSYTSETGYNPYCNNDVCLWMEKPFSIQCL